MRKLISYHCTSYVIQPDMSQYEFSIEVRLIVPATGHIGYGLWCNGKHLNPDQLLYTDNDEIPTAEQVKAFLVEIQSEPEG